MEINNITDALKAFNKIEDKRDEIRADYEQKDSKLREARDTLEQYLIKQMQQMGMDAFQLPGEGLATIRTRRRFGVADWSLFWDWVITNRCPNMLQKRLLDTAMQDYLDANGELPPAINTEARLTLSVTKRG